MPQTKEVLKRLSAEEKTSEQVLQQLGHRIQERRIALGLSIRDLAKEACCDKNTIMRMEKGLPTTPQVQARVWKALTTVVGRGIQFGQDDYSRLARVHRGNETFWTPPYSMGRFTLPRRMRSKTRQCGIGSAFAKRCGSSTASSTANLRGASRRHA